MSSGTAMRTTSIGIVTISFPLRLNITTIVNSSATSVIGPIFGTKRSWYHSTETKRSITTRVSTPAMHGMPR